MRRMISLFLALIAVSAVVYLCFKSGSQPTRPQEVAQQEPVVTAEGEPVSLPQANMDPSPPIPSTQVREPAKALLERIIAGDTNAFNLSRDQIQAFLARNRTNSESLLAAFNVSGDPEFLRQAARRYPKDPFVLVSVLGTDAMPEQRREMLDQFKQASPDNPLANYLAAREDLKNQQPEMALKEMAEAAAKIGFTDFAAERAQGLEELYLSAGHSPGEAKPLATIGVQEPSLPALRDLAAGLAALERQYAAAGDPGSAELIAKSGLGLVGNIPSAGTRTLATQLLGDAAERDFLAPLNPNESYSFLQQPISERLTQLQQDRQSVIDGMQFYNNWLSTASESQLIPYFDRMRLYGEAAALNWARTQPGDPLPR